MDRIFILILKFLFGVILLPVVFAVTKSFADGMGTHPFAAEMFRAGIFSYVIMHFFIYTPSKVYEIGQKIFSELLKASRFLSAYLPYFFPFIPSLLLVILYIVINLFQFKDATPYFMLATGFALAMHVVLTANDLYEEDDSIFKVNYLFLMGLSYIINVLLMVVLLGLVLPNFSLSSFFHSSWDTAKMIYTFAGHKIIGSH